jgi:hypothetical protein
LAVLKDIASNNLIVARKTSANTIEHYLVNQEPQALSLSLSLSLIKIKICGDRCIRLKTASYPDNRVQNSCKHQFRTSNP